jgi:cyanophycinase-like exopeptidase
VKTISLLGSGEFETWAEEVDRLALGTTKSGSTVAVLLVGDQGSDLDRRADAAREHFARVGSQPTVVPLVRRTDAFVDQLRDGLRDVCMVHLSARDAGSTVRMLLGTPLWDAIVSAIEHGAAFAASDAAIAALGDAALEDAGSGHWEDWPRALRLFAGTMLLPHWDAVGRARPEVQQFLSREVPTDGTLIGIDDRTALIGDGDLWQVKGAGQVQIRIGDVWNTYGDGAAFLLPSSVTVLPEAEPEEQERAGGEDVVLIPDPQPAGGPDQEPDLLVG